MHSWWHNFGAEVDDLGPDAPVAAREFVAAVRARNTADINLLSLRVDNNHVVAIAIDVEVERPQDLANDIRATEPVAIVFGPDADRPAVLSLRPDFPDTPHQNWSPEDAPPSLCVDDRPWQEARLTYSARDLIFRVQLWLAKAARGELQDSAQPLDPLFFRSSLSLVVPPSVFSREDGAEIAAFQHPANPTMVLARPAPDQAGNFAVIAFAVPPEAMTRRMRSPPTTIAALASAMEGMGLDLLSYLRDRIREWATKRPGKVHRLGTHLAILIDFPIADANGQVTHDPRAFITHATLGELGVSLGVLLRGQAVEGQPEVFVPALPSNLKLHGEKEGVDPAQVYLTFTRPMATAISGHQTQDTRRVVLIGAGSLGSQMSLDLAREGRFAWTVIDNDFLLPHNLARHGLPAGTVGALKAPALAYELGNLLGERFEGIVADILDPGDERPRVDTALGAADAIIDTSASVAVSRHLSDLADVNGRRLSAFFNPTGTAVVVLAEPVDRSLRLRDLEAQYHSLIQSDPQLEAHLAVVEKGVRYSGSCRALTNRIPASRAAMLSAIAAQGVTRALDREEGTIGIWTIAEDGGVTVMRNAGLPVHHIAAGGWAVTYDDRLADDLARMRAAGLPAETGGVLMGITDMTARSIHVCYALPAPEDSEGSVSSFERGVVGLEQSINQAIEASLYQLRYVGEWHSHPSHASAMPSGIDLAQLAWLAAELDSESVPALMCIVADDGRLNFISAQVIGGDDK